MSSNLEINELIEEVNNIIEEINSQEIASEDQLHQLICAQGDLISKLIEEVRFVHGIQNTCLKFVFDLTNIINNKGVCVENDKTTVTFLNDEIENLNRIKKEAIEKGLMN